MAQDRNETFDLVCEASKKIFVVKDAEYDHATSATGVLGATVELVGIIARLKKMVLKSPDNGASKKDELKAILKDAHNYVNIAMIELADDNWSGK